MPTPITLDFPYNCSRCMCVPSTPATARDRLRGWRLGRNVQHLKALYGASYRKGAEEGEYDWWLFLCAECLPAQRRRSERFNPDTRYPITAVEISLIPDVGEAARPGGVCIDFEQFDCPVLMDPDLEPLVLPTCSQCAPADQGDGPDPYKDASQGRN